jgi:PKD repeat protein
VTTLILIAEAEPDEGPVPLEVKFRVEADEPMVDPKYEWDFGDGSPESNEAEPKHTYRKPGLYTVTVEIKDQGTGYKGKDSLLVDALEPEGADVT